MEITEVRIKLMDEPGERLKAFCSITFDNCFVVRDLKIIEGTNGPFVAMPSRKLTSHCPRCRSKNHLRAQHCNQCGSKLATDRLALDHDGRAKLYADIAHPINSACREMIQDHVIEEFEAELDRAKQPGYVSRYDDFDIEYDEPSSSSSRGPDTRVDQAHGQPKSHTPKTGGSTPQPAPTEKNPGPAPKSLSPPARPEQSPESNQGGGFGAGIFPNN